MVVIQLEYVFLNLLCSVLLQQLQRSGRGTSWAASEKLSPPHSVVEES